MVKKEVRECFKKGIKDFSLGKKHKGLLIKKPDDKLAEKYLDKAKKNIELCELYKNNGFEYMIPEAWFYALYYCALAILSKFGVESRNQRCTASFLRYVKDRGLLNNYDDEFINRITIYSDQEEISDVDEREKARYGPYIESEEVSQHYDYIVKDINNLTIFLCLFLDTKGITGRLSMSFGIEWEFAKKQFHKQKRLFFPTKLLISLKSY